MVSAVFHMQLNRSWVPWMVCWYQLLMYLHVLNQCHGHYHITWNLRLSWPRFQLEDWYRWQHHRYLHVLSQYQGHCHISCHLRISWPRFQMKDWYRWQHHRLVVLGWLGHLFRVGFARPGNVILIYQPVLSSLLIHSPRYHSWVLRHVYPTHTVVSRSCRQYPIHPVLQSALLHWSCPPKGLFCLNWRSYSLSYANLYKHSWGFSAASTGVWLARQILNRR